ncbi:hypothetical protein DQ04_06001030 [Trypanosoma grayi]|uniref:hypothetical protein n=1 Tax=Trypanosoma grayi TaxID=71804 RepID=UPI0004F49F2E|nr:hypothetical protein DQ04_06001030 [Trypanosoma grayi]KEG09010.1 hypothetical protein DQ04_06001030 [Trypanosoma grayi]
MDAQGQSVTAWLRALERRYAHAFDATLSRLLSDGTTHSAAAAFLARHLSGTRYELLEVRGCSGRAERLPLFACLLHPLPEVRLLAAKALDSMTAQQLITSSSAATPSSSPVSVSRGGNSLLELLEHVAQYEQSEKVASQLLHTAATAAERLLALAASRQTEEEEEEADGKQHAAEQRLVIAHLRGVLHALWRMAAQHNSAIQVDLFRVVLKPLLQHVKPRLSTSPAKKKKMAAPLSSESAAFQDIVRGLALYYVTLQYVDAVDRRAAGRLTNSTAEDETEGDTQLCELIAELEQQLCDVVPDVSRTAALLIAASVGTTAKEEKDDTDSSDDETTRTTKKQQQQRKSGSMQVTGSSAAAKGNRNGCLSVFECVPLLQLLREEAAARLQPTLAQLQSSAEEGSFSRASRVVMLECCLSCAARLATSTTSDADAVVRTLLQFFLGEQKTGADNGYLASLQEAQRAASRHEKAKVGRGAKNSLAVPYVPQDELTSALGATVRCSMEVRLTTRSESSSSSSPIEDMESLVRIGRLLGYLSTPLPAMALSPARLPPAYLRLLELHDGDNGNNNTSDGEARFPVDWFSLVFAAVYRTHSSVAAEGKLPFSLTALSLTLLCPLAAPESRRESVLQELQAMVLAPPKGERGAASNSARVVVKAAMQQEKISVTTLSALIEAMARAESRGGLTGGAAELLCRMMAEMCVGSKGEPAMPFSVSRRAMEHFFPLRGNNNNINNNNNSNNRGGGAACNISMAILLPVVEGVLATGGSSGGAAVVSPDAADFLHAVCLRAELSAGDDAFLQLCVALLRHPFLRVAGDRVRPVYRHALSAFAAALSRGLEAHKPTSSVLFIPQTRKGTSAASPRSSSGGNGAGSSGEEYMRHVAATLTDTLLGDDARLSRLGGDAAMLLVGTLGGYHRLFLPWLARLVEQAEPDLSALVEVVEALAAPSTSTAAEVDAWEPPSWCALQNPLTFTDAQCLLQLCGKSCGKSRGGEQQQQHSWSRHSDAVLGLRLLCSVIAAAPSIRFDDDDEAASLFTLINGMLESFPLSGLLLLLAEVDNDDADNTDSNRANKGDDMETYHRCALAYVRGVVDLCVSAPHALNEVQPHGAARIGRTLVKQCVILMAALLVPDSKAAAAAAAAAEIDEELDSGEGEGAALSRHRIDTIAEILRIVSPLFTPAVPAAAGLGGNTAASRAGGRTALHIPIVALLIRLEAVDFSSARHRYESAMDVCSSLLTSFDVHTQLACLTQMMRLVLDPHQQLSAPTEEGEEEEQQQGEEKDVTEDGAVVKLYRKLVKPNQVINRQEGILHLINTTVKSEAFLGGFLELQHSYHHRSSEAAGSLRTKQDGDNEADEQATGEVGTHTNDACMALLVATLELFAHYAELNAATPNDATSSSAAGAAAAVAEEDETLQFGENKAFVMLMELLAGNTLACVLAGINELTFVACLQRLLTDTRVALQQKGLEVLLDRLHHALPTVEHTLTDAEVAEHRRQLRDPKCKLTLMDLVRVKARPLATKRSFALFTHLTALLHASVEAATTQPSAAAAAAATAWHMLPLCVSCMEETVRIVGSGGSLQAEKTLLNVHRANRVTEATLSKLFGNKARVQEVHRWVDDMVALLPRLLRRDAAPAAATAARTTSSLSVAAEGDALLAGAAMLTALGTVCQVMGTSFTTPHSNNILQSVTGVAVFAVAEVAPVVSRSEAGSLLRQAALGCLLRVFPSCWLMCQPYLPRIVFAATHLHNVDDGETNYRSSETMSMLEALLEPQLFIEACTECLRGVATMNPDKGGKKPMRVRVDTHSFALLYTSVRRRVAGLKREELLHLSILVEGATVHDNFWLASLQALAAAPALPSRDIVQPVLEAYEVFFLKFRAKHCARYLSAVAEWAFGGAAEGFLERTEKQQQQQQKMDDNDSRERDDAAVVPRSTMHGWLLFYALCNHLLERLSSIFDFGFPIILPYIVSTLTGYCSAEQHTMRHAAGLIALTLESALECVRRIAAAQTAGPDHDYSVPVDNYLATPEVFNAVMPAVVRQLTNLAYLVDGTHDYGFRAEHHVVPAVRALFQSLAAPKLQSRMQHELLKTLRHQSRHVRRLALLCLDGIYADGGDELAARLMAEMLPAVVEMTEDRDDAVVEQARRLCNNLSAITGQDVLYAMSA